MQDVVVAAGGGHYVAVLVIEIRLLGIQNPHGALRPVDGDGDIGGGDVAGIVVVAVVAEEHAAVVEPAQRVLQTIVLDGLLAGQKLGVGFVPGLLSIRHLFRYLFIGLVGVPRILHGFVHDLLLLVHGLLEVVHAL